ncbi:MAG: NADH-quinone oxidoreductase subunit L [Gemmatimonadetes bacterium]|nr:NADH-quinone oxidoreductase subunit L [Gemmatimonadota bacterium]
MTEFHPLLPGLIPLLPLLGFLGNGMLALVAGVRGAAELRAGAGAGKEKLGELAPPPWMRGLPSWIGPGAIGAAFLLTLMNFVGMARSGLEAPAIVRYWDWISTGGIRIEAALQLDQLSMIMMLVITGVGLLIHVFSVGYMREDPGYARYFAYLNLFVFFMLVLVMGASFPLMFVGWEGVGLCSYLLIGFWFEDREKADAGKKAFIVNRIGDFGFLVAIFLLFTSLGAVDYAGVFGAAPELLAYGGSTATAITLFLLIGAAGKSAQIPLYVWLPDAMAGPTPVSALIHAATMVTAGVYLVVRASVLFALAPAGSATVAAIGAATALFAATIALQQYDIKKVLAYSTVSQLGFMFMGVGAGAYVAGVFHLVTHAFFKGLLFLGAGAVIHSMHHALHATHKDWDAQDMRNMGGLRHKMPVTWVTMGIATLAIAGIWPFAGFFSKDEIVWYAGAARTGGYGALFTALWGVALVAAVLTAIYMTRLMVMTFYGSNRTGEREAEHLHEAPLVMTIPLSILAVLSLFGGWLNVPASLQESVFGGFGLLPMSDWLERWLEPVTELAQEIHLSHAGGYATASPLGGGAVLWAGIATGVALVTVGLTFRSVSKRGIRPASESGAPVGVVRGLLYHKWYVDELYDRVFVRPLLGASRIAWRWVDQILIDGSVNAVGSVFKALGWFGSLFQTGQVTTYAFVLTLGALAVLGALLL